MWGTLLDAQPRLGVAVVIVAAGWVVSRLLRRGLRSVFRRRRTPSFSQVMSKVVGWAVLSQDILENTPAGMLLLFRRPSRASDQIEVDQSGTVTEINIRETRLTTYGGESVIIPNRDVYKNVIRVHTDHDLHRLEFDVGIAYRAPTVSSGFSAVEPRAPASRDQYRPVWEARFDRVGQLLDQLAPEKDSTP